MIGDGLATCFSWAVDLGLSAIGWGAGFALNAVLGVSLMALGAGLFGLTSFLSPKPVTAMPGQVPEAVVRNPMTPTKIAKAICTSKFRVWCDVAMLMWNDSIYPLDEWVQFAIGEIIGEM
jgi:hypothetical protein